MSYFITVKGAQLSFTDLEEACMEYSDKILAIVFDQYKSQSLIEHLRKPMPGVCFHGQLLFRAEKQCAVLQDAQRRSETGFGREILPRLLHEYRILTYDFGSSQVPGTKAYEETAYWRDVGTLESYWKAYQDLLGQQAPFRFVQSSMAKMLSGIMWMFQASQSYPEGIVKLPGHIERPALEPENIAIQLKRQFAGFF